MEELHFERQVAIVPEGVVGAKADVAPLIVGDVEQPLGDLLLRLAVGLLGELLSLVDHVVQVEGERPVQTGPPRR